MAFPVLCADQAEAMIKNIETASSEGDSLGGILETAVIGMPKGVGEPWFDSIESMISHAMFSIPAVKAVEFGAGFDMANMKGSEANDSFMYENGEIITLSGEGEDDVIETMDDDVQDNATESDEE